MRIVLTLLGFALFFVPLGIMVVLDGFCGERELCHAGLYFTLLLYGVGFALFVVGLILARLMFRALRVSTARRVQVLKLLMGLLILPGVIVSALLIWSYVIAG